MKSTLSAARPAFLMKSVVLAQPLEMITLLFLIFRICWTRRAASIEPAAMKIHAGPLFKALAAMFLYEIFSLALNEIRSGTLQNIQELKFHIKSLKFCKKQNIR